MAPLPCEPKRVELQRLLLRMRRAGGLRRSTRSEPGGQRVSEPPLDSLSQGASSWVGSATAVCEVRRAARIRSAAAWANHSVRYARYAMTVGGQLRAAASCAATSQRRASASSALAQFGSSMAAFSCCSAAAARATQEAQAMSIEGMIHPR